MSDQESLQTFFANECLQSRVRPPAHWRDCVGSDSRRDDERFGIVHDEGREFFLGTFDQAGLAAHQVEHVDGTARVMSNGRVKPVAAGFDELQSMEARTLLAPSFATGNGRHRVDQFALCPFCVALPGDVGETVIDVDGTRLAVKPHPTPVPELEGEDVGRGADFQYDAACAGTMYRPAGNQEVIVSPDRPSVDIGFSGKRRTSGKLGGPKIRGHGFSVDT